MDHEVSGLERHDQRGRQRHGRGHHLSQEPGAQWGHEREEHNTTPTSSAGAASHDQANPESLPGRFQSSESSTNAMTRTMADLARDRGDFAMMAPTASAIVSVFQPGAYVAGRFVGVACREPGVERADLPPLLPHEAAAFADRGMKRYGPSAASNPAARRATSLAAGRYSNDSAGIGCDSPRNTSAS